MATIPHILDVYPANGAQGIVLSDRITVLFDQEMDRSTINEGTFVLQGPDVSTVFSPVQLNPFDIPGFKEEDINSSPYVQGYVKGSVSFEKIDEYGQVLDESTPDYDGEGNLWRTRAIFTPDSPLEPGKEYVVVIAGDESPDDDFDSGVRTRTVFDTRKTAGSGSAFLRFNGGYTGENERSYTVRFTTSGAIGTAEYEWWDNNDPLTAYAGVSSTGDRELEDGIYVSCDPDGVFEAGDTFTTVVIPAIQLEGNFRWTFFTGSGSIQTPPSTSSASGIEGLTGQAAPGLEVISIEPADQATNLDPNSISEIIITFNMDLDPATITDDTVTVWSEPVNGDYTNETIQYTGVLATVLSVEGNVLRIQIT